MAKNSNPVNMSAKKDLSPMEKVGAQMLSSGQVTPEEVQAAQIGASDPKGTSDWLTGFLGKQGGTNPYTLNPLSQDQLPSTKGLPSGKNKQSKSSVNQKQDTKTSQTKNLYATPEDFASRLTSLEELPFFQDQKRGIDEMENALSMQMNRPQPQDSDYWVRPLIALTDSMTGSKLMAGFKPQETMADRNKKFIDMKDDIQKRRSDYNKQLLEGLTKMKEGTESNSIANQLAQSLGMTQGMLAAGGGRYGDPDDQRAFRAHQANIQALKKDTNLRQNLSNMQRIENGLNNAVAVEKLTPQSFHELQQAIRSSITKGTGGVDERAETYYKSMGLSGKQLMQFISDAPQNLSKNDPFVKHVLEIGKLELENLKRQNMNQAKMLTSGNRSIYEDPRYKHYQADLDDLLGTADTLYTPALDKKVDERLKPKGKKTAQAPAGEKPLEQMSNDELKAFIKANGG